MKVLRFLLLIPTLFLFSDCKHDEVITSPNFKTEYIIVILIDGPRYSETWGESSHHYIPGQDLISKEGVVFTNFHNKGTTNTMNGHTAITTGFYENLSNGGAESPENPSLFQLYLEHKKRDSTDVWIVSSKDKLQALGDCKNATYKGHFIPSTDCGNSGLFTGYREDSVTFKNVIATLSKWHPHFIFVSLKQPDASAHLSDWRNYLEGIQKSDAYAFQIWQFIQSDTVYRNKTSLFITNDHGRHLDGVADGFGSHGDGCEGCRHIMLLAAGPDFNKNISVGRNYGLTDLNATISYLFGLKNKGTGEVIQALFR